MPTNNSLRLDDRQGIHNRWRNLIEPGENKTTDMAERQPLRGDFCRSTQHIKLLAQRHDLRLERSS